MKKKHVWLLIAMITIIPILMVLSLHLVFDIGSLAGGIASHIHNGIPYVGNWPVYYVFNGLLILTPIIGISITIFFLLVSFILWCVSLKKPKVYIPTYCVIGTTVIVASMSLLSQAGLQMLFTLANMIGFLKIHAIFWEHVFYYLITIFGYFLLSPFAVLPFFSFVISLLFIKEKKPAIPQT